MNIIINGFRENVPEGATISFLITHFKEGDSDLIVEHNGHFVYPQTYDTETLSEGDQIEFINPNFGG